MSIANAAEMKEGLNGARRCEGRSIMRLSRGIPKDHAGCFLS